MNKLNRFLLVVFVITVCSFVGFSSSSAVGRQIYYQVTPFIGNDAPKIKFRVSFKGDKSGLTKIKLPLEFGGQENLYQGIRNLTLMNQNAKLEDSDKPEIKIVSHVPNEEINLEYELVQDWIGAPQAGGASGNAGGGYRPIIQKDYFHFLGSGAWILPNLPEDSKLKVSIDWQNLVTPFTLANSFGTNQTKQTFSTDVESFSSSVFVGGDYQINKRTVKGKPIFIATRGRWNFANDDFANLVEKIVAVQREFWKDNDHPYFLVTLLPIEADPNSFSIGGTGLTDSFATFVTSNATLEDLKFLISHEYFHNWNTIAFGGMKEPEQLLYWFSEGFTDYYTYRLLLRGRLIDLEKYSAKYNEFLSDYYLSPVRNEDNQRVLRDFFKDSAVSKLPYRRGFLLATKWNEIIRRQSNGRKSLDDVMQNILRDSKNNKFKKLSKEYLISVLSKYAEYDFAGDVEKYVEKGETIGDFSAVLGPCIETFEKKSGKFEIGFDFDAVRKNKKLANVMKESAAFDAGLRDGQKVLSSSVYFGNTNKPIEVVIEQNGQKKKIEYLPETKDKVMIPQFRVKDNLPDEEIKRCSDGL
jgi:predicted metalloprotease with PDZ domain